MGPTKERRTNGAALATLLVVVLVASSYGVHAELNTTVLTDPTTFPSSDTAATTTAIATNSEEAKGPTTEDGTTTTEKEGEIDKMPMGEADNGEKPANAQQRNDEVPKAEISEEKKEEKQKGEKGEKDGKSIEGKAETEGEQQQKEKQEKKTEEKQQGTEKEEGKEREEKKEKKKEEEKEENKEGKEAGEERGEASEKMEEKKKGTEKEEEGAKTEKEQPERTEEEREQGDSPFKVEAEEKPEQNSTVPLNESAEHKHHRGHVTVPIGEQNDDQNEQIHREEKVGKNETSTEQLIGHGKDGTVPGTKQSADGKLPEGQNESHPPSRGEEKPIVFPTEKSETDTTPTLSTKPSSGPDEAIHGGEEEEEEKMPQPGRAQITHMSQEGDKMPKEKATSGAVESQKHQHELEIGRFQRPTSETNGGSDAFEVITREEGGQPTEEGEEEQNEQQHNHNQQPEFGAVNEGNHGEESSSPVTTLALPTTTERAKATEQTETTRREEGEGSKGEEAAKGGHAGSDADALAPRGPPAEGAEKANTDVPTLPTEGQHSTAAQPQTTAQQSPAEEHAVAAVAEEISTNTPKDDGEEDTHQTQRGDVPVEETTKVSVSQATTPTEEGEAEKKGRESTPVSAVENEVTQESMTTAQMSGEAVEKHEMELARAFRTPFLLRLTKIEWRPEFGDLSSGPAKKLQEQIRSELHSALSAAVGPGFLDYQIEALHKGSVIVEGQLLSRSEISDAQNVAMALEQAIVSRGGELGGNAVDTEGISVAGLSAHGPTGNGVAANQRQQQEEAESTGFIIGGAVVVGVLIVVFAIFAIVVFGVNNRRNNGTLKLKEEICMVENGKGGTQTTMGQPHRFTTEGSGVNLTGLRTTMPGTDSASNGHSIGGRLPPNGQQPIILSGSQFSTPSAYNAANNRP